MLAFPLPPVPTMGELELIDHFFRRPPLRQPLGIGDVWRGAVSRVSAGSGTRTRFARIRDASTPGSARVLLPDAVCTTMSGVWYDDQFRVLRAWSMATIPGGEPRGLAAGDHLCRAYPLVLVECVSWLPVAGE